MESLLAQKPTILWRDKLKEGDGVFTNAIIVKSDKLLDQYLHNLSKARETSEIWKAIEQVVKGFDKLNVEDDGFIDFEEREELKHYIKYAAETYGLKFEGDPTEEYRREW